MWMLIIGGIMALGGIGLLFEDFFGALVCIAIGALFLFLGIKKKYPHWLKHGERDLQVEDFHLVGVSYYHANIKKLASVNPQWKLSAAQILANGKTNRKVYHNNYVNKPVKLIPESNNPHDKNAVAVHFAGELVGYISMEQNLHVLDILKHHEIKYISGFIGGGEYKIISSSGDIAISEDPHSVNVRIGYV